MDPFPSCNEWEQWVRRGCAGDAGDIRSLRFESNPQDPAKLWTSAGADAIVFQVYAGSVRYALRLFHKRPDASVLQRYDALRARVGKEAIPGLLDFHRKHGVVQLVRRGKVKDIPHDYVLMQWSSGQRLSLFLRDAIKKPDGARTIQVVREKLRAVLSGLNERGIAHGDLHLGNVLVTTDNVIHLVDYDSMWIAPRDRSLTKNATTTTGSGKGFEGFIHPKRSDPMWRGKEGCFVDYFPARVLDLLIVAVVEAPQFSRWFVTECERELVFSSDDFSRPRDSTTFGLLRSGSKALCNLVEELEACLRSDPDRVAPDWFREPSSGAAQKAPVSPGGLRSAPPLPTASLPFPVGMAGQYAPRSKDTPVIRLARGSTTASVPSPVSAPASGPHLASATPPSNVPSAPPPAPGPTPVPSAGGAPGAPGAGAPAVRRQSFGETPVPPKVRTEATVPTSGTVTASRSAETTVMLWPATRGGCGDCRQKRALFLHLVVRPPKGADLGPYCIPCWERRFPNSSFQYEPPTDPTPSSTARLSVSVEAGKVVVRDEAKTVLAERHLPSFRISNPLEYALPSGTVYRIDFLRKVISIPFRGWPELEVIRLQKCNLKAGRLDLSACTRLRHLEIAGCETDPGSIEVLLPAEAGELETLFLAGSVGLRKGFASCPKLNQINFAIPELESLDITHCTGLRTLLLKGCRNLKELVGLEKLRDGLTHLELPALLAGTAPLSTAPLAHPKPAVTSSNGGANGPVSARTANPAPYIPAPQVAGPLQWEDPVTHLVWSEAVWGIPGSIAEAQLECRRRNASPARQSGVWRLPTVAELSRVHASAPFRIYGSWLWSATKAGDEMFYAYRFQGSRSQWFHESAALAALFLRSSEC